MTGLLFLGFCAGLAQRPARDALGIERSATPPGLADTPDAFAFGAAAERSEASADGPAASGPVPSAAPAAGRTVTMTVTAYCPCRVCCGRWADTPAADRRTAGGYRLTDHGGRLVAADRALPFGAAVLVPGYGRAIVADRGGAIRGDRLDVLMPTHQAARAWGVQTLTVTIYDGGRP